MHRQTSSPTKPARLVNSLRRTLSVGHSQERRQPPSRSISIHIAEATPIAEHRASFATPSPQASSSRPSLHHRSMSVGSASGGVLSRRRHTRRFGGPSPALSPTLPETPLELLEAPSPMPSPSAVGAGAERSVIVIPAEEQATGMHAQVGVWEEQPPTPSWAAYEHAVASVGLWQQESVGGGPSKDPFATAAPSYISGPRPAGARGRRDLAINTLVSSNTAYMMASIAGSLDSDSADGSTLVANTPVSVASPHNKRASVVSASPSTKTRFTSRLQRAMRKLRGGVATPS